MDLLVAERDPLVRETVVETLQDAGFEVSGADCAEAALEIAAANGPPAVLMTDPGLGQGSGFNGANLVIIIRRWQPRAGILYTIGDPECVPAQRLEAHEQCLAKPFSSARLICAIYSLMSNCEVATGPAPEDAEYRPYTFAIDGAGVGNGPQTGICRGSARTDVIVRLRGA